MEIPVLTAQQIDDARARNTIEISLVTTGVGMIGALLLGLFCGIVARILVPGDVFRTMSGPLSWLISLVLGLVGYLIFTVGFGSSPEQGYPLCPFSTFLVSDLDRPFCHP